MTNNNSQKGFAMPVVIAIVAVVLVLGGVVYYADKPNEAEKMTEENAMMEKKAMEEKAMEEKEAMMEKKEVAVILSALNNSGQSGKAVLQDMGGKTKVVIEISSNPTSVEQPAHIHTGSCPNPGAVVYPLNNVVNGKSETVIDVAVETLKNKLPLAINVHKSAAEAKTYVSCGDITFGAMMEKKDEGAMMDKGETMMKYSGVMLAGKSAPLLDFTKADYDAAIKTDKLVVLYFYANWCPTCKAEVVNALYPAFNELTTDKVVGIRINYKDSDTDSDEKALAAKYGIPYQHTKVFVKNGKQLLKAPDGWDKARYLDEINKVIAQ